MRCGMRCKADWRTNSTPRSCRGPRPVDRAILDNHNVSTQTGFNDYISDFGYSRVDGRYAADGKDLRLVMGSDTYAHAGRQYRHANADDVALDRLTKSRAA